MKPSRFLVLCVLAILLAAVHWSAPGESRPRPRVMDQTAMRYAHIGGSATDVVIRDHYAYVGYGGELALIDIANAARPRRIGYSMLSANDLAMRESHVLVAGRDGLRIVDITDPSRPAVSGHYSTSEPALGVAVAGHTAYVVTGRGGLHIVDVTNPRRPRQLGYLPLGAHLPDIEVAESHAYIVSNRGLHVMDVSDPRQPTQVAELEMPGFAPDLALVGDRLLMTNEFHGLCIIDVSVPTDPAVIDSVALNSMVWDVAVVGDVAYVASTDPGLHVVADVLGEEPTPVLRLQEPDSLWALASTDNQLFGVNLDGDLHIIDLASAQQPRPAGVYDAPGYSATIAAHGNRAYVVSDGDGSVYQIVGDGDGQLQAQHLGIAPDHTVAIAATENGFVASGQTLALWAGVRDETSDLDSKPIYPASWALREIAVADNCVYGVGHESDLLWVEQAGGTPLRHGTISFDGGVPHTVAATNGHVYVGTRAGLAVLTHSPGNAPVSSSLVGTPGAVDFVRTSSSHAFIIVDGMRLCAVDLARRAQPVATGCVEFAAPVRGAAIHDSLGYVALGDAGVTIVGLEDPARPAVAGSIDVDGNALDVAAADGFVFVAAAGGGVLAVRL